MANTPPNQNPNPNVNQQQENSLKRIQGLLDQINRSYSSLGERSPFGREAEKVAKGFENTEKTIQALDAALEGVTQRIKESKSSASDLLSTLQSIVKEINPKAVNYTKDFESGFKKIINEAKKLQYEEEGINKLSLKELEALDKKIKMGYSDASISAQRLLAEKGISENIRIGSKEFNKLNEQEQIAIRFLKDQESIIGTINDKIKVRIALEKKSEEIGGLASAGLSGIESALNKLGFNNLSRALGFDEANDKMKELADDIAKNAQKEIDLENEIASVKRKRPKTEEGKAEKAARLKALKEEHALLSAQNKEFEGIKGKMAVLSVGAKSMGASLMKALKDPTALITFFGNELISALTKADKETGELAKAFGTSYANAASLRNELNSMANLSGDVNINTGALQKSLISLNKEFGTSTMMSGELLKDFTRLTTVAGYSEEAAAGLSRITVATGTDLSKNTEAILGEAAALNAVNGLALNEKQIVEEVAKASAATTLSLGMQPKELAKAVVESKALGASLQEVEQISQQLLQFESSIGNELEAELLTGRDLNLETARRAALNGDIATVAKEIKNQVGSAADFTKMNVIQQEALAKAVGMNREQLAKSLIEQEALQKIGAKDAEAAKKKYDRLVSIYGVEEASRRLGDAKYAQQLQSQSVQERFNATIEKLREIFVSIAEPILQIISPIMDLATTILPLVNVALSPITAAFKFIGESIQFFIGGIKQAYGYLMEFVSPIKEFFKNSEGLGKVWNGISKVFKVISPILKFMVGYMSTAFLLSKAKLGIELLTKNVQMQQLTLSARNALLDKRGLFTKIGEASMSAIKAVTSGLGTLLGPLAIPMALAAAASVAALGYKFMTGDDAISEGYGKRTLLAGKDAIALNDNDTVVAGTDLLGKKKNKQTESQSAPSSVTIDYAALSSAIVSALQSSPMNVSVKGEVDGKVLLSFMEKNATGVGTALNKGTSKVQ
jgi:hypothetical protein